MNKDTVNILLVEDNLGDAKLFELLLAETKYRNSSIKHAKTLSEALGIIEKKEINLILLDLNLPDSSKLATFNSVNVYAIDIPIIVLTGLEDEELGNTLVRMGAQDYLVKGSFDSTLLNKTLEYSIIRNKFVQEINERDLRFKKIIEENADGMVVLDSYGNIKYSNSVAAQIIEFNENYYHQELVKIVRSGKPISEIIVSTLDGLKKIIQVKLVKTEWENEKVTIAALRDLTDLIEYKNKIEHLNRLLRAVRNINHLISSASNEDDLIREACNILEGDRDYTRSWILLIDNKLKPVKLAQTGPSECMKNFENHIFNLGQLELFNRFKADDSIRSLTYDDAESQKYIFNCFNKQIKALSVPIKYNKFLLGILTVELQTTQLFSEEEIELLNEVASDLGLALHLFKVETRERMSRERLLWLNEAIKEAANGIILTNFNSEIQWVNPAFTKMTGYTFDEVIGKKPSILKSGKQSDEFYKAIWETISNGKTWAGVIINKKKNGELYHEEMTITPVKNETGETTHFIAIKSDVTKRVNAENQQEKNRRISEALFHQSKMIDKTEEIIIEEALEKAVQFTESQGGYLHFVNEDKKSLQLFKWSKSVLEFCKAENLAHYPVEMAGIWADCFRTGKPAIHNDYPNQEGKNELPEGHFPLYRHMSIPVFEGDNVVAICGVGNKEKDYTEDDVMTLNLFMNEMWKLISRKRALELLKENEERYRSLYENATIGIYRTSMDGKILMANPAFLNMLELDAEDLQNTNKEVSKYYFNIEELKQFRDILDKESVVYDFESQLKTKTGKVIHIKESAKKIKTTEELEVVEGVVEDISELKAKENELIEAKNIAEAMGRMKGEFLAQMSHEIRTPLNGLLSTIDYLKDVVSKENLEDSREIFEIIDVSGERIIKTIESVLNMSELQTGTYELIKTEFNLFEGILEPVFTQYKAKLNSKNLCLNYVNHEDELILYSDRYAFTQIIENIYDNSIKYTEQGEILVEVEKLNNKDFKVTISDTGIGISREYLENIFEAFSQEYQGYSRPYDGCGLGLSITKKYCEVVNAEIEIESERGKGTKVAITFKDCLK